MAMSWMRRLLVPGSGALSAGVLVVGILTNSALAGPEISLEADGVSLESGKVVAWGHNDHGQSTVPQAALSGVTQVACGEAHTVALKGDGSVIAWGSDAKGQSTVPSGLGVVKAIGAGLFHTLAVNANGAVVGWGDNEYGQSIPPVGLGGVVAVEAGMNHSMALKADGTVVCWGRNDYGQAVVPAGLTGVKAISAGYYHNLALKTDGKVVAWGRSNAGQTSVPYSLRVVTAIAAGLDHSAALQNNGMVAGWGTDEYDLRYPRGLGIVQAIAAGEYHSAAVREDGTVGMWGRDDQVPAGLTGVRAIAAGGRHTVAIAGSTVDFGNQTPGVYGPEKTFTVRNRGNRGLKITGIQVTGEAAPEFRLNPIPLPTTVPNNGGTATFTIRFKPATRGTRVASLRILSNDAVESAFDVLLTGIAVPDIAVFDGDSTDPADKRTDGEGVVPFPATPAGSPAAPVRFTIKSIGGPSLLGLGVTMTGAHPEDFLLEDLQTDSLPHDASTGFAVNFRPTVHGERTATIVISSNDEDEPDFEIHLTGTGVSPEIAVEHAGAGELRSGRVVVWGDNQWSQTTVPQSAQGGVKSISVGRGFILALKGDGSLESWGDPDLTSLPRTTQWDIVAIAAGFDRCAAVKSDGTVVGWGSGLFGETAPPSGLAGVTGVAVGSGSAAVLGDGTVIQWGYTDFVPEEAIDVVQLGGGSGYFLARRADGTVVAWGESNDGTATTPSGLGEVEEIAAGYSHCLATKRDGSVVGWGTGSGGAIVIPSGLQDVRGIAAGDRTSLALLDDDRIVAWGRPVQGVPPELRGVRQITAGYNNAGAVVDDTINFQSGSPGTTGSPETVVVRNYGNDTLQILGVEMSGGEDSDFVADTSGMADSIPAGEQTSFLVRFSPSGPGVRRTTLRVLSNDRDEGEFGVALYGQGLTALDAWRFDHFATMENSGETADDQDFDHDGLANLIEFAFGTDPTVATPAGNQLRANSEAGAFSILYRRPEGGVEGVTYGVEQSQTSLDDWSPAVLDTDYSETTLPNGDGTETVTVTFAGELDGRRFARVVVSYP